MNKKLASFVKLC